MFTMSKGQVDVKGPQEDVNTYSEPTTSVANTQKNTWRKLMPVVACGAGLFSDGYLNNVC
jgi:hypothetical protein